MTRRSLLKRWNCLLPFVLAAFGCHWCDSGTRTAQPPAAPTAVPVRPVQPGVLPISPANASIEFTGSTSLMSQTGRFAGFDGTLEMPTADPKDARIHVTIDVNSTTTNVGLLTKHLKGEDFFDVAHYPTAEFESERITPTAEAGRYQIVGQLALHGVRKAIAFPARIVVTPSEVVFDGTLTIRQSEFGMIEAARKTKDDVPVKVSVHARRN
jgi:polyisoprenoid-binding protein YceI